MTNLPIDIYQIPPNWQPPDWLPPANDLLTEVDPPRSSSASFTEVTTNKIRELFRRQFYALRNTKLGSSIFFGDFVGAKYKLATVVGLGFSFYAKAYAEGLIGFAFALALTRLPNFNDFYNLKKHDINRIHARALQNPLYAHAWKEVNKEKPLSIEAHPITEFIPKRLTVKDQYSTAMYSHTGNTHRIAIWHCKNEDDSLESLVFETMNAWNEHRFKVVERRCEQGLLSQEEYTFLVEFVENDTIAKFHQIYRYGQQHIGWPRVNQVAKYRDIEKHWAFTNLRSHASIHDSHADNYRRQWKKSCIIYYLRNPGKAPRNWVNEMANNPETPATCGHASITYNGPIEQDPIIRLIELGMHSVRRGDDVTILQWVTVNAVASSANERLWIQRAKALLAAGAGSHLKDINSDQCEWLRKHCPEEMRILDEESTLPDNWKPPSWLSPAPKLTNRSGKSVASNDINAINSTKFTRLRQGMRKIASWLNKHPQSNDGLLVLGTFSLVSSIDSLSPHPRFPSAAIALISSVALGALAACKRFGPLASEDISRLTQKALQNRFLARAYKLASPDLSDHASYAIDPNEFAINYMEEDSHALKIIALEILTTAQAPRFIEIQKMWHRGEISRQEFARATAYVKHDIQKHFSTISGGDSVISTDFEDFWKEYNSRSGSKSFCSKADDIRHHWNDLDYLYYLKHPDEAPRYWVTSLGPLLVRCAKLRAEISEWERDPFLQLIERGADVNTYPHPLSAVIENATKEPQHVVFYVERANALLRAGADADRLTEQEKTWLNQQVFERM